MSEGTEHSDTTPVVIIVKEFQEMKDFPPAGTIVSREGSFEMTEYRWHALAGPIRVIVRGVQAGFQGLYYVFRGRE